METDDEPQMVIFTGSEKSSITIFNYDANTGAPIAGSYWKIERVGGSFASGRLPTNTSGMVTQGNLEPGTYLVKEVATDDEHVVDSTPQQIELKAGQTATQELVFSTARNPASIW